MSPDVDTRLNSEWLQADLLLPLRQVRLFVSQIIVGVAQDRLLLALRQACGGTCRERPSTASPARLTVLLGNQRAGGDDGACADARAVQDDDAHADQAAVFDHAAVQRDRVADGDPIADDDATAPSCRGARELSCMLEFAPMRMECTSPRTTAFIQTLAFSPSTTSPMICADSST